ncbi:MAG TPA: energy transducer TonB [Gemmatimonadales bacterium]|nr:energy transducer TonB [Gemmatimonadales bacterium]
MRALRSRATGAPPLGLGLAGSVMLHITVAAAALSAGRFAGQVSPPPAYRVELVAAPQPEAPAAATATTEPPRPAEPAAPARSTPALPVRDPTPAPAQRRSPPDPPERAPAHQPERAQPVAPGGAAGVGSDPATVRTEGVEFPFPGYLRNLVAQVYRRWRPPAGNQNLEAEIFFIVHRDGTISSLRIVRRSGSYGFDLEAQGAVEAAARSGAFGPLPDGYGADVLPVSFFFTPGGIR